MGHIYVQAAQKRLRRVSVLSFIQKILLFSNAFVNFFSSLKFYASHFFLQSTSTHSNALNASRRL